jgi:hypothetical protein
MDLSAAQRSALERRVVESLNPFATVLAETLAALVEDSPDRAPAAAAPEPAPAARLPRPREGRQPREGVRPA